MDPTLPLHDPKNNKAIEKIYKIHCVNDVRYQSKVHIFHPLTSAQSYPKTFHFASLAQSIRRPFMYTYNSKAVESRSRSMKKCKTNHNSTNSTEPQATGLDQAHRVHNHRHRRQCQRRKKPPAAEPMPVDYDFTPDGYDLAMDDDRWLCSRTSQSDAKNERRLLERRLGFKAIHSSTLSLDVGSHAYISVIALSAARHCRHEIRVPGPAMLYSAVSTVDWISTGSARVPEEDITKGGIPRWLVRACRTVEDYLTKKTVTDRQKIVIIAIFAPGSAALVEHIRKENLKQILRYRKVFCCPSCGDGQMSRRTTCIKSVALVAKRDIQSIRPFSQTLGSIGRVEYVVLVAKMVTLLFGFIQEVVR
ncbi:cellular nucleic acid-binding protein [Moniliophthora roreri]|nr:cellular nucleic acid-binding protein [Moniliophthora roreri]